MPAFDSVIVYVISASAVGLALDWAIFERFKMIVGAFGDSNEVRYRDLPFWRTAMIIPASALIGFSVAPQSTLPLPFWAGAFLFICLNAYADTIAYKR